MAEVLRTPPERFRDLPGFPFDSHDVDVDGIRIVFVDEGPRDAEETVLLLHGEPTWSYLYRKMIPPIVEEGHRVVVPDFPGFGRSDKLSDRSAYTYQRYVDWMRDFLESLSLGGITLFCQDWGGLVGLRLVAEQPERFARVVAANTGLPTGEGRMTEAFENWQRFSQEAPEFPVGQIVNGGCATDLPDDVIAAYDAPFPDDSYKEAARIWPALVPTSPDDPAVPANRRAWQALERFEKPFLTAFSDGDPITRGGERPFQDRIPGAKGRKHKTIEGAGHFLQEDEGPECAKVVCDLISST